MQHDTSSAAPATQNEDGHSKVPHLPRKMQVIFWKPIVKQGPFPLFLNVPKYIKGVSILSWPIWVLIDPLKNDFKINESPIWDSTP